MGKNNFRNLFEEINIGKVCLKNRVVMAPMVMCYAGPGGEVNEQLISHFEARVMGGVGFAIVEASYVHPSGKGFEGQVAVDRDALIPGLNMLANAIKVHGAASAVEIYHGGIQASVEQLIGPSAIGRKDSSTTPREMTTREVEEMVEHFAEAALRTKEAGFDMVEVHGTHGYLIAEFLSPLTNKRGDKYGADRVLFAEEIIDRIREKCGPDFPILLRLISDEHEKGGLTIEDAKQFAKRLEAAGVDAFDLTAGTGNCTDYSVPPVYYDNQGYFFKYSSKIKKAVNVPVISGGMIMDPEIADKAIGNGIVDLVFLGRQIIADPEWPNKVRDGKYDSIKPCIACGECSERIGSMKPVNCSVNPLKSFEYRYMTEDDIPKARERKKIAIVGGGLGGLEAARIAKIRGHQVILFEESNDIGGILKIVAEEKHKKRIKKLMGWYSDIVKSQGVELKMKTKVTPSIIEKEAPDAVILATGSDPITPDIPEVKNVVLAEDVYIGKAKVGNIVVIIGGGLVGCELALHLSDEGKKVTIVEALPEIATDEAALNQIGIEKLLDEGGVSVMTCMSCVSIVTDGIEVVDSAGRRSSVKADTIILSVGRKSKLDEELLKASRKLVKEVYVIGDAKEPRKIIDAIGEGFWTALRA